jgi:hypothetical protein
MALGMRRWLADLLRRREGPLTGELAHAPGGFGLGQVPARLRPDAVTRVICGFCSTGCSLDVHLQDGAAVNLSPTRDHVVNLGAACAKGWEALAPLRAPDRATTPLLRTASGQLEPVDWDTAIATFVHIFQLLAHAWGVAELFERWSSPEAVFRILAELTRGQPCDISGIAVPRLWLALLHAELAYVVPEVKLEIAELSDAAFTQDWNALLEPFPPVCAEEDVLRRLQLEVIRQPPRGVDDRLGGRQCLLIKREYTPYEVRHERIELSVRNRTVDPSVAFRHVGAVIVGSEDDLQCTRPPDQQGQPLKRAAAGNQTGRNLGLTKDRRFAAREAHVEGLRKFASASTNASTDHRDAQDAALRKPAGGLDPPGNTESALLTADTVVCEEEIRVCALERHDLQRGVRLDVCDEIVEGVVHPVVDDIDRRIVQRHSPMALDRLVGDECLARFTHVLLFSLCPGKRGQ